MDHEAVHFIPEHQNKASVIALQHHPPPLTFHSKSEKKVLHRSGANPEHTQAFLYFATVRTKRKCLWRHPLGLIWIINRDSATINVDLDCCLITVAL